jgi:hypothetical protein
MFKFLKIFAKLVIQVIAFMIGCLLPSPIIYGLDIPLEIKLLGSFSWMLIFILGMVAYFHYRLECGKNGL